MERNDLFCELKELVSSPSYIYALCMMIVNDSNANLLKLEESDPNKRLLSSEISRIVSLYASGSKDESYPNDAMQIKNQVDQTKHLMHRIQSTYQNHGFSTQRGQDQYSQAEIEDIFQTERARLNQEVMNYSGEGIFDFQYIDFLEVRYAEDYDYLRQKYSYNMHEIKLGLEAIGALMKDRMSSVNLNFYRDMEKSPELLNELSEHDSSHTEMMEFALFLFQFLNQDISEYDPETSLTTVCCNAINALTITLDDLIELPHGREIIEMFTYQRDESGKEAGVEELYLNYKANPVIKLNNGSYFVPVLIDLYQAAYNRPFHLMMNDKEYADVAAKNRGLTAEKIVCSLLTKVFGVNNTYRSVNLLCGRNTVSEIDVLCVCGNYALVVQVKSKQLTMTAKTGDNERFAKDFKLAFQDAYDQGLKCRSALLNKDVNLIHSINGRAINIEHLKEAYILCVSTDNIAAISFLVSANISKTPPDQFPVALSVFELEIFTHYLHKPELFLYYMRQRTSIGNRLFAINEISCLAHHLIKKLWIPNKHAFIDIDQTCASYVDKDYYSFKYSIPLENAADAFNTRWQNKDFDAICDAVGSFYAPQRIDILFSLLDFNSRSIESMLEMFSTCRKKTLSDYQIHTVSVCPGKEDDKVVGISYIASSVDEYDRAFDRLQIMCMKNHYKYKTAKWIGLGCVVQSGKSVDYAVLNETPWSYDPDIEQALQAEKNYCSDGKTKIGRNELCICGSNRKFKKCCGK